MVNEIVIVDRRLDQLLDLPPAQAVELLIQEYQITYEKQIFVEALIAKLVTCRARPGDQMRQCQGIR